MITFILANHNRRIFIEDCLKSYHALDIEKELVVVDAVSNDGSCEILKQSADVLICEPDNSVYEAWNKAVAYAKGEWIFFLNSDDVILPAGFMKLEKELEQVKSDMVFGNVVVKDLQSSKSQKKCTKSFNFRQVISNPIYFNRFIFRKEIFQKIGDFDLAFKHCADQDFLWRCLDKKVEAQYFKISHYRYTTHQDSLTLNPTVDLFSEELEIAKKNAKTSRSILGVKMAAIWVKWEQCSTGISTRGGKLKSRLFNRELFVQQIYSIYLKATHQ